MAGLVNIPNGVQNHIKIHILTYFDAIVSVWYMLSVMEMCFLVFLSGNCGKYTATFEHE